MRWAKHDRGQSWENTVGVLLMAALLWLICGGVWLGCWCVDHYGGLGLLGAGTLIALTVALLSDVASRR